MHDLVGLVGRVVGPTRKVGSRATTGPERGAMLAAFELGGQGLAGRDGKMSTRKDGADAVGSCLAGPALTVP
jgi:hypothetical protein